MTVLNECECDRVSVSVCGRISTGDTVVDLTCIMREASLLFSSTFYAVDIFCTD